MKNDLQEEAERARYTLRSSFYYRVESQWPRLIETVESAKQLDIVWKQTESFGISAVAWNTVNRHSIHPVLVFCHPEVIRAIPPLITYYRCLAILPQKGAHRLAFSTQGFEDGTRPNLTERQAARLSIILNGLISLLIESDSTWSLDTARTAALLNLGSQINGSWRNEVGAEGSRRVKELLISHFIAEGLVLAVNKVDSAGVESESLVTGDEVAPVDTIRSFKIQNNYTFIFGSEPDVSLKDENGILTSTIEVKYGLDPAGALERYGAAKKSFEEATRENRRVHNIYLASCITPEVRRRISEDRLVNEDFNLTEVLADAEKRTIFLKHVKHLTNL